MYNITARQTTRNRTLNITPLLKQLYLLPVCYKITYKVIILCFKALNNLGPVSISDMLTPYRKECLDRRESQAYLEIPKTNLKSYGDHSTIDSLIEAFMSTDLPPGWPLQLSIPISASSSNAAPSAATTYDSVPSWFKPIQNGEELTREITEGKSDYFCCSMFTECVCLNLIFKHLLLTYIFCKHSYGRFATEEWEI